MSVKVYRSYGLDASNPHEDEPAWIPFVQIALLSVPAISLAIAYITFVLLVL